MSFYGREFEWESQEFANTRYVVNFGGNPMEAYQGGQFMVKRIMDARVDGGLRGPDGVGSLPDVGRRRFFLHGGGGRRRVFFFCRRDGRRDAADDQPARRRAHRRPPALVHSYTRELFSKLFLFARESLTLAHSSDFFKISLE